MREIVRIWGCWRREDLPAMIVLVAVSALLGIIVGSTF